jgi:3-oxoacid CoA-transferase/3-oxoacid CoA-transferase subunit A
MDKVVSSAADAIKDLKDGAVIMAGGFGLCGNPENLIAALKDRGLKNLTIISNNCGTTDKGLGVLLAAGQVAKMVSSYVGENKEFERRFLNGELEVELNPQGTLAERIRAAGAGIPAFFTPTGYGTWISDGGVPQLYSKDGKSVLKVSEKKETRQLGGKWCVLETALHADVAMVKAWKGDRHGNLVFRKTARNFNPMMCTAAKVTIAEVEHLVDVGELDPDNVHVPGIYVKKIFTGKNYVKPIEQKTTRPRPAA